MEEQDIKIQQAPAKSGPGKMLRQTRIDLRVELEEIASALNLAPRQLSAIENDDYEHLPESTYVRGYLRGYAQLLGLAPEKVLERYNNLPVATKQVNIEAPVAVGEIKSDDRFAQYGVLALVVVVVGLALLWWQGKKSEPVVTPLTAVQSNANNHISSLAEEDHITLDDDVLAPEKILPPSITSTITKESVPSVRSADKETNTAIQSVAEVPLTNSTLIEPDAPRSRLVLYVLHDSWIDIRDANQNKLVYETVTAGRVVSLEGVAPFSVFLGYVDGVRIEFNGREYDPTRHRRGTVARFTLNDTSG